MARNRDSYEKAADRALMIIGANGADMVDFIRERHLAEFAEYVTVKPCPDHPKGHADKPITPEEADKTLAGMKLVLMMLRSS